MTKKPDRSCKSTICRYPCVLQACLRATTRGTTIAILQSRPAFRGACLRWLWLGGGIASGLARSLARPPVIPILREARAACCVLLVVRDAARRCETLRGFAMRCDFGSQWAPPRPVRNLNRTHPPAHGPGAVSPKICVMPKACEARQSRDRRQPELASCRA